MFGDSVAVVNDKESARAAVMRLSRVSGALYKKNLDVSRYIHAEHSWTNRLKQIYDDIGGRVL
ncbi:hypothetical protein DBB_19300 [Desulfoluna spongiiphila]|nr:hypothetical protein DBB_19300 [Desulfoluna spongiiphila]